MLGVDECEEYHFGIGKMACERNTKYGVHFKWGGPNKVPFFGRSKAIEGEDRRTKIYINGK